MGEELPSYVCMFDEGDEDREMNGMYYVLLNWLGIPPVLYMREGGICAVDISHLSNFL